MLFVIPLTGPVLLNMLKSYSTFLSSALTEKNMANANVALNLIELILHLFYSLNCVEFPEFFEDTLGEWMSIFKFILELKDLSEEILSCKTHIIKNVTLYCERYSSDFEAYIMPFFNLIWDQVEIIRMEPDFDKFVSAILRYLRSVVRNEKAKCFFTEKMPLLFSKLLFPNIVVTENDIDQFDNSPDTYISNDLEEADTETRRRNCIDLIRSLAKFFPVNEAVNNIVQSELVKYNQDPKINWSGKVNIINMLIGAHASQYTFRNGATAVTVTQEEFLDLLKTAIFPELDKIEDLSKESSFIKSACVKYLFIFRNNIPAPWMMVFILCILIIFNSLF